MTLTKPASRQPTESVSAPNQTRSRVIRSVFSCCCWCFVSRFQSYDSIVTALCRILQSPLPCQAGRTLHCLIIGRSVFSDIKTGHKHPNYRHTITRIFPQTNAIAILAAAVVRSLFCQPKKNTFLVAGEEFVWFLRSVFPPNQFRYTVFFFYLK